MAVLWASAFLYCLCAHSHASEFPSFGDSAGALERARIEAAAMPGISSKPAPVPRYSGVYNPWKLVTTPSPKPPESIGSYAAGCLRGAQALELHGAGFEVMRPSRHRNYGHPRLLSFLRTLGANASSAGLGSILVGDLGQPRGGPTLSGHASHMNGLDVDLWYLQVPAGTELSPQDRETMSATNMVLPDFGGQSKAWNPKALELLRLAASDASVERIFVNPVVKQAVCKAHPGEAWVRKLRPYWGHDDHCHARLFCTPGDAHCSVQEPVPAGDGCGAELADWLSPEKKAENHRQETEPAKPPVMPHLPALCQQVLSE